MASTVGEGCHSDATHAVPTPPNEIVHHWKLVCTVARMAGQPFHKGSCSIRRLAASWEPFSFCYISILRAVQRWLVFWKSDDDDDDLTRSNNIYFLFISSGKYKIKGVHEKKRPRVEF